MRIFLIRHGKAEKIENESILTKEGLIQAKNVAKILKKLDLDLAYTSSLTRAKQTLDEYKKLNPSINVVQSEDLCEIYRLIVGGPEKIGTSKDREEKDKARADNFYDSLLSLKEKNVAVFSHGNIIRYFLSKALGISPKGLWSKLIISPGSISIIEVNDKKAIQVKAINLYEHQKDFLKDFLVGKIITEEYL